MKKGDQLPGSILPPAEWQKMKDMVEQAENPKDVDFRANFFAASARLGKKYCVGKNKGKCIYCGNEQNHETGICSTCRMAFYNRGVIRCVGRVREVPGCTGADLEGSCIICGKTTRWGTNASQLCRNCYRVKEKNKFTMDELIENRKRFYRLSDVPATPLKKKEISL